MSEIVNLSLLGWVMLPSLGPNVMRKPMTFINKKEIIITEEKTKDSHDMCTPQTYEFHIFGYIICNFFDWNNFVCLDSDCTFPKNYCWVQVEFVGIDFFCVPSFAIIFHKLLPLYVLIQLWIKNKWATCVCVSLVVV